MIHRAYFESNIIDNRSKIIEKAVNSVAATTVSAWQFTAIAYIVKQSDAPKIESRTGFHHIRTMSIAPPLSRVSLSQQIRDRLLSRIMSGTLKPGDRLVELKIAGEMATSQAPVREALRELEAMGVVETLRNKGARVRVITDEELRQIYDVRAQLEGYASELAAGTGADLTSRLEECVAKMRKAARKDDSMAFADHNMAFHRAIVEGSGNMVLLGMWETLNVKMRTMVNVVRGSRNLLDLAESHVPIIDAIAAGDGARAHEAAKQHVLDNKPETSSAT